MPTQGLDAVYNETECCRLSPFLLCSTLCAAKIPYLVEPFGIVRIFQLGVVALFHSLHRMADAGNSDTSSNASGLSWSICLLSMPRLLKICPDAPTESYSPP